MAVAVELPKKQAEKAAEWQPKSQFDQPPKWYDTMSVAEKLKLAKEMPVMNTGNVCQ